MGVFLGGNESGTELSMMNGVDDRVSTRDQVMDRVTDRVGPLLPDGHWAAAMAPKGTIPSMARVGRRDRGWMIVYIHAGKRMEAGMCWDSLRPKRAGSIPTKHTVEVESGVVVIAMPHRLGSFGGIPIMNRPHSLRAAR